MLFAPMLYDLRFVVAVDSFADTYVMFYSTTFDVKNYIYCETICEIRLKNAKYDLLQPISKLNSQHHMKRFWYMIYTKFNICLEPISVLCFLLILFDPMLYDKSIMIAVDSYANTYIRFY